MLFRSERAGCVHDVARDAEPLGGTGRCVCGYPARMLREVAAKRKILSEYNDVRRSAVDGEYMENGLRYAVETLTDAYSDHPDYAGAWRT